MQSKTTLTQITDFQHQILDGALLGDGCLYIHKNGKNANFIYTSANKNHVDFIYNFLKSFGGKVKEYTVYDKRTTKYYTTNQYKSFSNFLLTEEYNRWYFPDKHIPMDLKLTPTSCLIWYIGDGSLITSGATQYIKLATHCFKKEELENIILPQLAQFNPHLCKENNIQYWIYISHKNVADFLHYIGECPFIDYQYKWEYKEYTNSIPTDHSTLENIFCTEYTTNNITYYAIAKKYNVAPKVVRYYLEKNNLYKSKKEENKLKNIIVQFDNTNTINKIFYTSTELAAFLNVSLSYLSKHFKNNVKIKFNNFYYMKYINLPENLQKQILNLL